MNLEERKDRKEKAFELHLQGEQDHNDACLFWRHSCSK